MDFEVTKEAGIDFVDTIHIVQLHNPITDSLWMPSTLNLRFRFAAFGFQGSGYFHAGIHQYTINPEFPPGFFKGEVMKVMEGANKKDSAYWEEHRSVPLTAEEIRDYREKDSIVKVRSGDRYKDSVDQARNRFKIKQLILGYTYQNTKRQTYISFPGLLASGIQFNTVEGLNLSYRFSVRKSQENHRNYSVSGQSRYGFSNKLWGGELQFYRYYDPIKFSRYHIKVKSIVEQFNRAEPISPLINTQYTLLYNENHMKLFKESGIEGLYGTELSNGVSFAGVARYMQRDPLRNTSYFQVIDDPDKYFTSNDPQDLSGKEPSFESNRALTVDLILNIRFKQQYSSLPNEKVVHGSKYPALSFTYRKAVPALEAVADYDLAILEVSDRVNLKLWGLFRYRLKAGKFLRSANMYFMDYKHFIGNQTLVNTHDYLSSFRLLPYYEYSTNNSFFEGHSEYNLMGRVMGKLPLIKKLNLHEILGVSLLSTEKTPYYTEFSFGIDKLFKVLRVDYVVSLLPGNRINSGVVGGLHLTFD